MGIDAYVSIGAYVDKYVPLAKNGTILLLLWSFSAFTTFEI